MTQGTAIISADGLYRYLLTRQCPGQGATVIVMINPSTADASQDDATIRKLQGFGRRHEWGELRIVNLFALRATDVNTLRLPGDPVGPENDFWIGHVAEQAARIVVAWGSVGKIPKPHRNRVAVVLGLLERTGLPILSIGTPAKCGSPKHPLFQPYDSPLQKWRLP